MVNEYERLLTTYAYNILGSYEEAKDVVQDAYLKFIEGDHSAVEDKKAYMVRSVINLSINRKNKLKRQRDLYPGAWLPEPIATEQADAALYQEQILSYSLMVLLEKLNAKQRAVFILKEAFGYDHAEIAGVLDISEEHSRKLLSRAREQLKSTDIPTPGSEARAYAERYLSVIQHADMKQLERMLHDEVNLVSDGGGKVSAFRKAIMGKDAIGRLLIGVHKKFYANMKIRKTVINHEPAICYFENGHLVSCQIFSLRGNDLVHIYFIRNPDKLKMLEKNLSASVTF